MSSYLSCCLLHWGFQIPASQWLIWVSTPRFPQWSHYQCCSNVKVYTEIIQGKDVWDSVGFDFLHGQRLLLKIQNRYKWFAFSFWQVESWLAPSNLFPSKGILDFWSEGYHNCFYPDSYLEQTLWRLRVNVWRLMPDRGSFYV